MSIHKTKDGRWYCKFWEDGRYHKKYFGRGKRAKVEALDFDLSVKKTKLKGAKVIEAVEPAPRQEPRFDQLAQLYLNDKRNDGWSEYSVYNFKSYMNRHVIPCLGDKACSAIKMTDLVNLRAYIAKHPLREKVSPHTINRYIAMVRAIFNWGVNNEYISVNPWEKYRSPREYPDPPELLSMEEFIQVMNCAEPHCQWALDVEFNTGCRPGRTELFKLKYTDVN